MFNLLPDSLKDQIIKEYKSRRLVVILLFLIFIQLTFFVFIMPSWVISNNKENELIERVKKMDSSPLVESANSLRPIIRSINSELTIMDKNLKYPEFGPIFETILSAKTNSIKLTDVSYASNSSSTATISIQGVSSTRDSLVNYKNKLTESNIFKTVDLPISNYAKDKNIDFSMTLTFVFKK